MSAYDDFVERIVSHSGIPTSKVGRDLERELRAHLEDAVEDARSQGFDEAGIPQSVYDRFGDPDEIARGLAAAYRFERGAISIAYSLVWLGLALLTVAGLILTLQALAAMYSGISLPTAFPHLKEEIAAFASLALGYMGLYLEERLFQRRRLMKALAVNNVLFTFLFTTMFRSAFNHPGAYTYFRVWRRGSYTAADRSAIGLVLRHRGADRSGVSERRTAIEREYPFSAMDHSLDQVDGTHRGLLLSNTARKGPPTQDARGTLELTSSRASTVSYSGSLETLVPNDYLECGRN